MSNAIVNKTSQFYNGLPRWGKYAAIGGIAIIGLIIIMPLLKGIGSLINVGADILSAPGNLIKAINKDFDDKIDNIIKNNINWWVHTHTYNPNDPKDVYRMKSLEYLVTDKTINKDTLKMWVSIWKQPKTFTKAEQKIIDIISQK